MTPSHLSLSGGVLDKRAESRRATPWIRCEVCGRAVQLRADGTVRAHNRHRHARGDYGHRCGGSERRQARWPVSQLLWHHAGDLWVVLEDRVKTTEFRDYLLRCVRGREKGRVMVAHGEYMHRHGWEAVREPFEESYCFDCEKLVSEHAKCDGCGHYDCDCICDFLRDDWPTHPSNPDAVEAR